MDDYIVRATAYHGQVRAFAATTRHLVEEAKGRHGTSPVATAALGRLLTGGAMMGSMLKNEEDLLTIKITCDGPIGGLIVTADGAGHVRGYVDEPAVMLPAKNGKLDVGGAVGNGQLSVSKDMGLKEPYTSKVELVSGEIAEDLTYYYASSEQIPSSVGLGVLMEKDNTVKCAGGFILQMMPFATKETIEEIESRLGTVSSVTQLLNEGRSPEELLEVLLGKETLRVNDTLPASFHCNCSKERVRQAVVSVGKKEIEDMIREGKAIDVKCQFCNTIYTFSVPELKTILEEAK